MTWFKNANIATKLIVAFLIMALIAGGVGTYGFIKLFGLSRANTRLYEENTLGIQYADNAAVYYQRLRFNLAEMLVLDDSSLQSDYISKVKSFMAEIETNMKLYEEGILTETDRKLFSTYDTQWKTYSGHLQNMLGHMEAGRLDEVERILTVDSDATGMALQEALTACVEYNQEGAKESADRNNKNAIVAGVIMIVISVLAIAIAIGQGLFISKSISRPIEMMVDAANRLAAGDTNLKLSVDTADEVGTLANAFSVMVENIREQAFTAERIADGDLTAEVTIRSEHDLLGQKLDALLRNNNEVLGSIAIAAEQVSTSAAQVSDSSIALSQGATEQASSLEELTAAVEQISVQTKQSAAHANEADNFVKSAMQNAEQGSRHMGEMLGAMGNINDSSASISKIIKVIDDIAFQTNILALNAAVEAARAGQYGKGFAVVAEEVRNLAARSADAAKETTGLIDGSIQKAEGGTKIANETAAALNKIVEDIKRVSGLVGGIAQASNQQADGIAQLNQGLTMVSQVVQTNSATSEQSAAASQELAGQAEILKAQVGRYKLKSGTGEAVDYSIHPQVTRMLETNYETESRSRPSPMPAQISLHDNGLGKY